MSSKKLLFAFALLLCLVACKKEQKPIDGFVKNTATESVDTRDLADNAFSKREGIKVEKVEQKKKAESNSGDPNKLDRDQLLTVGMPRGLSDQRIHRKAYTASYNKQSRNPNWVAWHLERAHTKGNVYRTEQMFMEDTSVGTPRATDADYTRSGYDRGHMCPSGDNKWDETAQMESFYFTNCCPQKHDFNSGVWEELESRCRHWANCYGEVWIVCGPVYDPTKTYKTIGRNKVVVPDEFFKVVLARNKGRYQAIGFVYKNMNGYKPMDYFVRTIDEVERLTGYDFFRGLPDKYEEKVEEEADLSQWK